MEFETGLEQDFVEWNIVNQDIVSDPYNLVLILSSRLKNWDFFIPQISFKFSLKATLLKIIFFKKDHFNHNYLVILLVMDLWVECS